MSAEWMERTFAYIYEMGGARRNWLRGQAHLAKYYLLQTTGANLTLVMRGLLFGLGTPRGWTDRA